MNEVSSANYQPLSPLRFLERSAAVFGDKQAIVCGERRFTYRDFADEATRVANALRASGIGPGDRVAYLSLNVAELLIAHFAVPLAGGVLVALNTRLSAPEVGYICTHSGARILVVSEELLPAAAGAESLGSVEEVVVMGDAAGAGAIAVRCSGYDEFRARGSLEPLPWEVSDERSDITINYTSGTTGDPKGVSYSHRGAYLNALGEIIHSEHSSASVYLWTLPMFHCNGWCTTWGVTAIGGTHICLPAVRADVIWRLIDEHGVTHLNGAPAVMTTIARAPQAHPFDRPVTVTVAGAAPSPTMIAEMEALGARVIHVYGLTEVYGPYSVCEWQPGWRELEATERARKLARQGVGMVTAERMRVVDLDMNDVPADGRTMGEIVMRGNDVMTGYFRDPHATEQAFFGGWFHSGDLGVMHPDGYIELLDRAKDIVISGGENISTVEVEQALLSHVAVVDAAVIGVPDERWGERPRAFVVLDAGASASPDELIEHVRSRIARYKAPDAILFVDALPRTSTGKVQKYELRQHESARTSGTVNG
ncbi:MAG: long-chain-fatty-acid--CoA ligase [Solirubrobacteraceae bacterium]